MSNVAPGASVAAAEIVIKLDHTSHTFGSLMRVLRAPADAVVTAAIAELTEGGFLQRDGSRFSLSRRGRDLVRRCRPRRARRH
jgi:hypothetical protein